MAGGEGTLVKHGICENPNRVGREEEERERERERERGGGTGPECARRCRGTRYPFALSVPDAPEEAALLLVTVGLRSKVARRALDCPEGVRGLGTQRERREERREREREERREKREERRESESESERCFEGEKTDMNCRHVHQHKVNIHMKRARTDEIKAQVENTKTPFWP